MVKAHTSERRQWIRAKRVLSIEFRLIKTKRKDRDYSWHLSTTRDMSVGGVGFYSDIEYKVGDILEIHMVMSGILDIFRGIGKVVRVERKKTSAHYLIAVKLLDKELNPRGKSPVAVIKRGVKKYID